MTHRHHHHPSIYQIHLRRFHFWGILCFVALLLIQHKAASSDVSSNRDRKQRNQERDQYHPADTSTETTTSRRLQSSLSFPPPPSHPPPPPPPPPFWPAAESHQGGVAFLGLPSWLGSLPSAHRSSVSIDDPAQSDFVGPRIAHRHDDKYPQSSSSSSSSTSSTSLHPFFTGPTKENATQEYAEEAKENFDLGLKNLQKVKTASATPRPPSSSSSTQQGTTSGDASSTYIPTQVPDQQGPLPRRDEILRSMPTTSLGEIGRKVGTPLAEHYRSSAIGQAQQKIGDVVNYAEEMLTAWITPEVIDFIEMEPVIQGIEKWFELNVAPYTTIQQEDPLWLHARNLTEKYIWQPLDKIDPPEGEKMKRQRYRDAYSDSIVCAVIGNHNSPNCPVEFPPPDPVLEYQYEEYEDYYSADYTTSSGSGTASYEASSSFYYNDDDDDDSASSPIDPSGSFGGSYPGNEDVVDYPSVEEPLEH